MTRLAQQLAKFAFNSRQEFTINILVNRIFRNGVTSLERKSTKFIGENTTALIYDEKDNEKEESLGTFFCQFVCCASFVTSSGFRTI